MFQTPDEAEEEFVVAVKTESLADLLITALKHSEVLKELTDDSDILLSVTVSDVSRIAASMGITLDQTSAKSFLVESHDAIIEYMSKAIVGCLGYRLRRYPPTD